MLQRHWWLSPPHRRELKQRSTGSSCPIAAVVVVMVSAAALALGLEVGRCVVIAATRGTLEHTTGHLLLGLLWRCLRSLGLVAGLAAAGATLAGLACSTAGALGAGIAYLFLDVVILRHFFPRLVPWVLSQDALAEVRGHASSTATQDRRRCPHNRHRRQLGPHPAPARGTPTF